jgi:hypothetical protein
MASHTSSRLRRATPERRLAYKAAAPLSIVDDLPLTWLAGHALIGFH